MKRFRILLGTLLAVTALVAVLYVVINPVPENLPEVRSIWVTRFDYSTPHDIQRIIQNLGNAKFTDVFFQIRGNGTAFYKSSIEPWAYELSDNKLANLSEDPGWDPLQMAIEAAKPSGLRVHAYMNVLPGWKGTKDPAKNINQLWTAHPDWFMIDSLKQKMLPTSGWYSFLNPVIPEVRQHIKGIVFELCAYDVHGIHLDYIRYPHDYHMVADQHYPEADKKELMRHADFSYDSYSQGALFDKYGWDVSGKEVAEFRCESVSRLVRDISYVVQSEKPKGCVLSASVMGDPIDGKRYAYQDSGLWARQGLVDWVVQMNYGTKYFLEHLNAMKKVVGRRKFKTSVVVGVYCKNSASEVIEQLDRIKKSGSRGWAIFSYSLLFDRDHNPTEKGRILLPEIRP